MIAGYVEWNETEVEESGEENTREMAPDGRGYVDGRSGSHGGTFGGDEWYSGEAKA